MSVQTVATATDKCSMLPQRDCRSLAKALFNDIKSSVLGELNSSGSFGNGPRHEALDRNLMDIWGLEQSDLTDYRLPLISKRGQETENSSYSHQVRPNTCARDQAYDHDIAVERSGNGSQLSNSSVSLNNDDGDDDGDDGDDDSDNHMITLTDVGNTILCNTCNHSNKPEWNFCEDCGSVLCMQSIASYENCVPDYVKTKIEKESHDWKSQMSCCKDTVVMSDMVSNAAARSRKKTNTNTSVSYRRHWKCSSMTGPITLQHGRSASSWKQNHKKKHEFEPCVKLEMNSHSCQEMPRLTKGHHLIKKGMLSVSQSCLWTSSQRPALPGSSLKVKTSVHMASSCISHIQHLPDELLLHIFSFLEPIDLAKCARVSKHFQRVSEDSSLWKEITIVKRQLTDLWLHRLSDLQPNTLHLVCCHGGSQLSSSGLRQLFRSSAETLHRLNISGCCGGELTGVSLLLHCSSRCHNLRSLNVSWCHIRNVRALKAVLEANQGIYDLDLSGCDITDAALNIVGLNLPRLKRLHLYGISCITAATLKCLLSQCKYITDFNIGRCCKVNNDCLEIVANKVPHLQWLELRGCMQISDFGIQCLVKSCTQLQYLGLATCKNVLDSSLKWIVHLSSLRSLDVTSCHVSDVGLQHVVSTIGCNLVSLKLGSTCITNKSVVSISQSCFNLKELDLSFCRSVTMSAITSVVQSCERLKRLVVYGLPSRSVLSALERPGLDIELSPT